MATINTDAIGCRMLPPFGLRLVWRCVAIIGLGLGSVQGAPAAADGLGYGDAPPQDMCGLCHGLNGVSATRRFPNLAGQKAAYIEKQVRDVLAGRRSNDGGQMRSVVTEIEDSKIAEVARYFSALRGPPAAVSVARSLGEGEVQRAKEIFEKGRPAVGIPACAGCHLEVSSAAPLAPHLSAQHAGYLEKQLLDFREGRRSNDPAGVMRQISKSLSREDIVVLARYLSGLARGEAKHGR